MDVSRSYVLLIFIGSFSFWFHLIFYFRYQFPAFFQVFIRPMKLLLFRHPQVVASNSEMHFLNSCETDLTKVTCVDFGKFEFLDINISSWDEALYLACSSIFCHLDFIRPIRMISQSFKHSAFLKAGNYIFINTWNTEFHAPLQLRENKSRLKI